MRTLFIFVSSILSSLVGCGAGVEADPREPQCTTTVVSTYPVNGSSNFYYRDAIEFRLSAEDPSAEL